MLCGADMKLLDFNNLTQYMSPKSLLFWQENDAILAISQVRYADDSPNLLIVTGKKPMTLSQFTARLREMSSETQIFAQNQHPIFGFRLTLNDKIPHIILK